MPPIEVSSKAPAAAPITAFIDLGEKKPLAARATLAAHPGYADYQDRLKLGPISSPYLTASSPQLLALPGAGAKHWPDAEKVKILAAEAFSIAQERRASSLVLLLDSPRGAEHAADAAEGIALRAYKFDKYKYKKPSEKPPAEPSVTLLVAGTQKPKAKAAAEARVALCDSVNSARDLVNEPGSVVTPAQIESRAREVAKEHGLGIAVLDEKQLKKEGYEGLLSVGRGGEVPPRMIVLSYRPKAAKDSPHLGFLGKGITFDTGGISIKPANKMWEMKGDMAGAAAALFALDAVARAKIKVRLTVILVTAQNYVDEDSIVPGDVIKGRNGKHIHVDNTDAEGRLILTDGLWRAGEEKITHLIDIATLTGSIVRAIGPAVSGAFGNDGFVDRVVKIAGEAGEPCWKMPMVEEYIDLLKTDVADINNIGGAEAGSITAALFLREFLPEGISWTHLDIAGTFLCGSKTKYFRPGATGIMVRTLAAVARSIASGR